MYHGHLIQFANGDHQSMVMYQVGVPYFAHAHCSLHPLHIIGPSPMLQATMIKQLQSTVPTPMS